MSEVALVTAGLAVATFTIRLSGILVGQRLPQHGAWARALNALPGCLIVSLVSLLLIGGGPTEWTAGAGALLIAVVTRNLPLTMAAGIAGVWLLRQVS